MMIQRNQLQRHIDEQRRDAFGQGVFAGLGGGVCAGASVAAFASGDIAIQMVFVALTGMFAVAVIVGAIRGRL